VPAGAFLTAVSMIDMKRACASAPVASATRETSAPVDEAIS